MPGQGFSSPIDIGLPDSPVDLPDQLFEQFQQVYNAIRILHQAVGQFTGAQTSDTTNFLAASQLFKDTLQVGRMAALQVICSDAGGLPSGSMINLFDVGGNVLRARRAQGNAMVTRAHGYVDQSFNNGDLCAIYLWAGYLPGIGFTAGTTYYLSPSSPGALTSVKPVTPGMIQQEVGVGLGATDFAVKIATPIQL